MELRPYQKKIVDVVVSSTKSSIVMLPTGTGKTPVAACILQRLLPKLRKNCVFFVPKSLLASKLAASGSNFRGIVFVQQRVTTHILQHVLLSDPTLAAQLRPACLYATSAPATPFLSVSASESRQRIAAFASGECNLLIATVVAEEGMDVLAANCVIRFDPIINSVSLVQSRGRGRQADSSFVVLSERADRPVSRLAEVEKEQQDFVASFRPGSSKSKSEEAEKKVQQDRERNAATLFQGKGGGQPGGAVALLNGFCKKTKVSLHEEFSQSGGGAWTCRMLYESCLRATSAEGSGEGKKAAREAAAGQVLLRLRRELGV